MSYEELTDNSAGSKPGIIPLSCLQTCDSRRSWEIVPHLTLELYLTAVHSTLAVCGLTI